MAHRPVSHLALKLTLTSALTAALVACGANDDPGRSGGSGSGGNSSAGFGQGGTTFNGGSSNPGGGNNPTGGVNAGGSGGSVNPAGGNNPSGGASAGGSGPAGCGKGAPAGNRCAAGAVKATGNDDLIDASRRCDLPLDPQRRHPRRQLELG
jgi:hypothetical protein